jgi:hypothetical protein
MYVVLSGLEQNINTLCKIKETIETAFSSSFLDIQIWHQWSIYTILYDKRDDFNFANINLEYGVYFSQLIRSILPFEFSTFTTLPYSKFLNILLLVQHPEPLYGLLLDGFFHVFWSWLYPFSGIWNTVAWWKCWIQTARSIIEWVDIMWIFTQ